MKHNMLRNITLTIILVFAVISIASAGAVMKRDRDNGDRNSRGNDKSRNEQRDQRSSRDDRSHKDRDKGGSSNVDRSSEKRSSDDSSSSGRTMKDRDLDRTPVRDRDSGDRSNHNSNSDRDVRGDHGRDSDHRYDRDDDNKFIRNDDRHSAFTRERYHHYPPVSYRAPEFHSGRYHYTSGYPFYFDYALNYGRWEFKYVPDRCCRSAYFYYGYFPYVPVTSVVVVERPKVVYIEVPLTLKEKHNYYEDDYYLGNSNYGLDGVLNDIRRAWEQNNSSLLLKHTSDDVRIDVVMDKGYMYSVNAEDYRAMTLDAIDHTETISFSFDSVCNRGDNKVIAYGKHNFYSPDGGTKSLYISYELERHGNEWVIDQVGSSLDPLGR